MPISIQIDESKQLTIYTLESGVTSFEEIATTVKDLYEKNPTKNVLWDASEGSVAELTKDHIEKLASFSPRFSDLRKGGKTALYSPGDVAFGLSRMFEIIGNLRKVPIEIKVFRDRDQALQWLAEK
jgi:hypothetical protein